MASSCSFLLSLSLFASECASLDLFLLLLPRVMGPFLLHLCNSFSRCGSCVPSQARVGVTLILWSTRYPLMPIWGRKVETWGTLGSELLVGNSLTTRWARILDVW
uniref:Secreted protein n=1 Tax=Physcomitrium patens TaxID=3218 RepID=A0A2K1KET8_PHYPA|nr:hypothetical protein PHYPA_008668 [Physcomitrium patens]